MTLARIAWDGREAPTAAELRARLERDGFDSFAWSDAPRAHYEPHSHDHDESIWVVSGEITFAAGGETFRLGPGDRLMLPAGTVHTADAGPAGASYLIGERRA
jgi:quercetin dioxygenase-like cupin family protein